ncbi:MAG: NAD(P)/FAD-dependent oxidoreductase [Promethearchaeota archaeon]|nr:MAG: NAD(P)/FAD-dependent oxidoreductase [Candidatus Lokiarchaeota archaeon]
MYSKKFNNSSILNLIFIIIICEIHLTENIDVIIIGAGTAGTYLGWILAKNGHSVKIIEKDKRENVGNRLDVIHFESDRVKKAGLPPFDPNKQDCIEIRDTSTVVTPDFETEIKTRVYQTIVRLTPFLNKMYDILESDSVQLEFSTKYENLIFKDSRIIGVKVSNNGEKKEYMANLVVDASGTNAVVRTSLPEDYGVETFTLGPNDVMYVLLQYIKWKNPEIPHPETDTGYNYWLLWFGPSLGENQAILGVGQPGSYENARLAREDFLSEINLPPYEILKEEKGFTPYRRPPYSLVADAFLCIGDAAAITYPFSGHGVTATWMLCKIAAKVISFELKKGGYLTKERLWDINVNYFRDQGAKFAALLTQLSGILNFNKKEWSYFLKSGLIYKTGDDDELPEPNQEFEEDMSIKEMIGFISKIIGGLIKRKLSLTNVKKLLKANSLANDIKNHYERFPMSSDEFQPWVNEAKKLWQKKKTAIKKLNNVEIEYK